MPRYTRDEIITQALELASCPTLTQRDMPGGILDPNALSIKWLQSALDMLHNKYPFSGDVQSVPITFPSGSDDLYVTPGVYLPTNYILDVRNGILATVNSRSYRLERKSFQYFLNYQMQNQNTTSSTGPRVYCKINSRFKFSPRVSSNISGTLWYYAMPTEVDYNDFPAFPDEYTLIEFIRLKALEWTRSIDIGAAQGFLQKELNRFRADGLLDDSEYENIPIENNQVILNGEYINRNTWMGPA